MTKGCEMPTGCRSLLHSCTHSAAWWKWFHRHNDQLQHQGNYGMLQISDFTRQLQKKSSCLHHYSYDHNDAVIKVMQFHRGDERQRCHFIGWYLQNCGKCGWNLIKQTVTLSFTKLNLDMKAWNSGMFLARGISTCLFGHPVSDLDTLKFFFYNSCLEWTGSRHPNFGKSSKIGHFGHPVWNFWLGPWRVAETNAFSIPCFRIQLQP